MSLTLEQARDEMSAVWSAAWAASAYASNLLIWDDVGQPPEKSRDPWSRFTIRHADGGHDAIGSHLFRREGTIWIQLFAPTGEGLSRLDKMGMVALAAFEGQSTPGAICFRNIRPREAGVDGAWQRLNVLVDFEYNEVR